MHRSLRCALAAECRDYALSLFRSGVQCAGAGQARLSGSAALRQPTERAARPFTALSPPVKRRSLRSCGAYPERTVPQQARWPPNKCRHGPAAPREPNQFPNDSCGLPHVHNRAEGFSSSEGAPLSSSLLQWVSCPVYSLGLYAGSARGSLQPLKGPARPAPPLSTSPPPGARLYLLGGSRQFCVTLRGRPTPGTQSPLQEPHPSARLRRPAMKPSRPGPTRCGVMPLQCRQKGRFWPQRAVGPWGLSFGCPSGGTTPQSPPRMSDLPGATQSSRSLRPPC
ncbi:hypothetical protein NDU88_004443 [Pleurodeles waltl]|uniref:Uncharacterized protein n=1 Tax=Pleurodeles waltl TaxID=8319 RepID=A0AAV7MTH3_PLEWA|nr:hypothetical protein NDU88_004443 [Pleurodeles waltl]